MIMAHQMRRTRASAHLLAATLLYLVLAPCASASLRWDSLASSSTPSSDSSSGSSFPAAPTSTATAGGGECHAFSAAGQSLQDFCNGLYEQSPKYAYYTHSQGGKLRNYLQIQGMLDLTTFRYNDAFRPEPSVSLNRVETVIK
jgi:hypothetical protein